MAANFCSKCGNPLKPGTHFCGNCGAKVIDNTAPNSSSSNNVHQAKPDYSSAKTQPPNYTAQAKTGPTSVIELLKLSWASNFSFSDTYKTEDERYDIFLKCYYFYLKFWVASIMICGLFAILLENVDFADVLLKLSILAFFIVSIKLIYSILKESDILPILIKLCIGFVISCCIFIPLSLMFPPIAAVLVILSIYLNRKRIQFLKKYKRYLYLTLKANIIPAIFASIAIMLYITAIGAAILRGRAPSDMLMLVILVLFILTAISPIMLLIRFIKREHTVYKVPFLSMLKLLTTVNITFLCLFISFISLVKSDVFLDDPSFNFDGDMSGVAHAQATPDTTTDFHGNYADTSNVHAQSPNQNTAQVNTTTTNQTFDNSVHTSATINPTANNNTINPTSTNATSSQNVDFNTPIKEATTTYQVNDANNFQEATVTMKDDGTGTITSADQQNLGTIEQTDHSTVIKDTQGNIISTKDNVTGHVSGKDGMPEGIASTNEHGPHSYYDPKTGTATVEQDGFITDSKGNVGNITKK